MNSNTQTEIKDMYIKIEIETIVVFNHIVVNSILDIRLNELKTDFDKLLRQIKYGGNVSEIKNKAIDINVTIKNLMESTDLVNPNKINDFVSNLIKFTAATVAKYEEVDNSKEFPRAIRNELANLCDKYFKRYFGRYLDSNVWGEIKFYEWLKRGDFIYVDICAGGRWSQPERERYFSDDDLDKFFNDNQSYVIAKMLSSNIRASKVNIADPLSDVDTKCFVDSHKILPKLEVDALN
ncbi:hypothetical protein [Collimonas arenae]|uniref:hypothetical protein n=1 Tax=Collimonas arenae TaxID=279058 RepID=UPI0005719AD3|nr:hypothetical protein [Collimonas arenae]